jgi:hypothetical protein
MDKAHQDRIIARARELYREWEAEQARRPLWRRVLARMRGR